MTDLNENQALSLFDSREFVAPRAILEMYQKISFSSFKVWASLLTDITEKDYSEQDQFIPLTMIWRTLDGRLSYKRLEKHLEELQTTLIKKDEYLPQSQERKLASFSMLGSTEITINENNDVTSLKYRFVKELLQILRTETDKELFVIEMRTFISLKGEGGEHAKNLLLYCTPHIQLGCTPFINLNELRNYMGLNNSYVDEEGNTIFKTFNRDVLKKAVQTLTENPYITFDIEKIEQKRVNRKVAQVRFIIKERRSIKTLLSEAIDDHSSPINPPRLRTMLITYWAESNHDSAIYYGVDTLQKLLKQFRFVDKYINEIINIQEHKKNPVKETYRIFSIATAVTQLWLDGKLKKENSKIYNYGYKIFTNAQESQIDSLCQKFIINADIKQSKGETNLAAKKEAERLQKHNIIQLDKALQSYKKLFIKKGLEAFNLDEMIELDQKYIKLAKAGEFGTWPLKVVNEVDDISLPLIQQFTRRTLHFYKTWIAEQSTILKKLPEKSVKNFLSLYPDKKRYTTFLNIPVEIDIHHFTSLIESLKARHKI